MVVYTDEGARDVAAFCLCASHLALSLVHILSHRRAASLLGAVLRLVIEAILRVVYGYVNDSLIPRRTAVWMVIHRLVYMDTYTRWRKYGQPICVTRHIRANPLQHERKLFVARRPQIFEVELAAVGDHIHVE